MSGVRVRRGNCDERSEELWVGENRQLGCWGSNDQPEFRFYSSSGLFSHTPNGGIKTISDDSHAFRSDSESDLTNSRSDRIGK